MEENLKKKLTYIAIGLVAIFVVFIWHHQYTWDGDGAVNVFPESDSVKNYSLDAYMSVTRYSNGWFGHRDEYSVSRADWPNGGYLEFDDCKVKESERSVCVSQDGTEYRVEVDDYPEPPEADSGS